MGGRKYRIEIPRNPDSLMELGDDIYAKHQQDGDQSPIPQTMADDLKGANDKAKIEKGIQDDQKKESVRLTRDLNLELGIMNNDSSYQSGTMKYCIKSVRDVLSGNYRSNLRKLNEWGFDIVASKGELKVILPSEAEELLKLSKKILAKNSSDGPGSPLKNLDMAQLQNLYDVAKPKFDYIDKLRKGSQTATEAGNNRLGISKGQTTKTSGTVLYFVCSVRDILTGIYRGNERNLSDWGFSIVAATAAPNNGEAQPQAVEAAMSQSNGVG